MFGPLKEALLGWRFASNDEIKDTCTWLRSQPKTCFADGIRRLVNHYTVCVEKRADYVEKWYSSHLLQSVVHKVINSFTFLFLTRPCIYKYYCH
jgi:hypothetical protein